MEQPIALTEEPVIFSPGQIQRMILRTPLRYRAITLLLTTSKLFRKLLLLHMIPHLHATNSSVFEANTPRHQIARVLQDIVRCSLSRYGQGVRLRLARRLAIRTVHIWYSPSSSEDRDHLSARHAINWRLKALFLQSDPSVRAFISAARTIVRTPSHTPLALRGTGRPPGIGAWRS